jgi:uncharacterized cupin superfamily protein
MHRSVTMDVIVILEGEVELSLDGSEVRLLGVGDSVVTREAMHRWVNASGEG